MTGGCVNVKYLDLSNSDTPIRYHVRIPTRQEKNMGYPTMARVRIFDFVANTFSETWCDTYSEALKAMEKNTDVFYFIDVVEVTR